MGQTETPETVSLFAQSVAKVLTEQGQLKFTKPPALTKKEIQFYSGKMKVSARDKFNGPCFISMVYLYLDQKAQQHKKTCGVIILYVHAGLADSLLVEWYRQGQVGVDQSTDVDNSSGADTPISNSRIGLFKKIIEHFVQTLAQNKYPTLCVSEVQNYNNNIDGVLDYTPRQPESYEIAIIANEKDGIRFDIALDPLRKK